MEWLTEISLYLHSGEQLVSFDSIVSWIKDKHKHVDRKNAPKLFNVKSELGRHIGAQLEINWKLYFPFTSFMRYVFHHYDDFHACEQICKTVCQSVLEKTTASQEKTVDISNKVSAGKVPSPNHAQDDDSLVMSTSASNYTFVGSPSKVYGSPTYPRTVVTSTPEKDTQLACTYPKLLSSCDTSDLCLLQSLVNSVNLSDVFIEDEEENMSHCQSKFVDHCHKSIQVNMPSAANNTEKTLLSLYCAIQEINIHVGIGKTLKSVPFEDLFCPHLVKDYQNHFTLSEWRKICMFEWHYSHYVHQEAFLHSTVTKQKWALLDSCKQAQELGKLMQSSCHKAITIERQCQAAGQSLASVLLEVDGVMHCPGVLELDIQVLLGTVLPVLCITCPKKFCPYDDAGLHFLVEYGRDESIQDMGQLLSIYVDTKHKCTVHEVLFFETGGLRGEDHKVLPRFTAQDLLIEQKLSDMLTGRWTSTERMTSDVHETGLCVGCYKEHATWFGDYLDVPSFNVMAEWAKYIPLPIQLQFTEAFLNTETLKQPHSQRGAYIQGRLGRLYNHVHGLMGVLNQKHHGMLQLINTDEMLINHHNAGAVFSVLATSGSGLGKDTADRRLQYLSEPDLLYYNAFLKKQPLTYQRFGEEVEQEHLVSIQDCHIVVLMDNLVRWQFIKDPEPGRNTSLPINTLPITLLGVPKDSLEVKSWHSNDCDGGHPCDRMVDKPCDVNDIDMVLLELSTEEDEAASKFQKMMTYGLYEFWNMFTRQEPVMVEKLSQAHHALTEQGDATLNKENSVQEYFQQVHSDLSSPSHETPFEISSAGTDDQDEREEQENEEKHVWPEGYNWAMNTYNPSDESSETGLVETDEDTESAASSDTVSVNSESSNDSDMDDLLMECPGISLLEDDSHERGVTEGYQHDHESSQDWPPRCAILVEYSSQQNPPFIICHPIPAMGRDDDISCTKEVLDDIFLKLKDDADYNKIVFSPDFKISENLLKLRAENKKYQRVIPECPVLHARKSKITNLMSAYGSAGLKHWLKMMRDHEGEQDWKKLVDIGHIETATIHIMRVAISLHIAFFCKFLEYLPTEDGNKFLQDFASGTTDQLQQQWSLKFESFICTGCKNNATFRLHREIMAHCDEVVALHTAERLGGKQGYHLLVATLKSALPFAFLNNASSYAGFSCQLLAAHASASPFHKNMKTNLFSLAHKKGGANVGLDAYREMDHIEAVKAFRPGASESAIIQRMALVDHFSVAQGKRSEVFLSTFDGEQNATDMNRTNKNDGFQFLMKTFTQADFKFIVPLVCLMLTFGGLDSHEESKPRNVYHLQPKPLPSTILDSETYEAGKYLIKRYAASVGLLGMTEEDLPSVDSVVGPKVILSKIRRGKSITINRTKGKAKELNVKKKDKEERRRTTDVNLKCKVLKAMSSQFNTCQSVVDIQGNKLPVVKHTGIRTSLLIVLTKSIQDLNQETKEYSPQSTSTDVSQFAQKEKALDLKTKVSLKEMEKICKDQGLIMLDLKLSQLPKAVTQSTKVITVEFAGQKFAFKIKSGIQFVHNTATRVIKPLLRYCKQTSRIIICEEKYSFTPDVLKAATRAKRQSHQDTSVSHLKRSKDIVSSKKIDKEAVTKTAEGKKSISTWLARNIGHLPLKADIIIDIDSEHQLFGCKCSSVSSSKTRCHCKLHTIPLRAQFSGSGFISKKIIVTVEQRKGEAEADQVDWLLEILPSLEEGDAILAYVTSGDIDSVVLHMLAMPLLGWPLNAEGSFQHSVYVLLKKPGKKFDLYNITAIVSLLCSCCHQVPNADVVIPIGMCMGGNDFLLKFQGITHITWLAEVLQHPNLLKVIREEGTEKVTSVQVDHEEYLSVQKTLYCPAGYDASHLSYEEILQISVKKPGKKEPNPPWKWLLPVETALKMVDLINSIIKYMLTIGKPMADVPSCPMKVDDDGDFMYDLGSKIKVDKWQDLLTIPETQLAAKLENAKATKKKKKRPLEMTPTKPRGPGKRRDTKSTPRKDKEKEL